MRQNGIKAGVVMMRPGTVFPESVEVEEEGYSQGWGMITNVIGQDLDRRIRSAGWTLFFMAGSIQANASGRYSEQTARSAMRRVLAKAKSSTFNVEITELSTRTMLGIPYIHITAHSRHVQSGNRLGRASERIGSQASVGGGK
jgi:hypothetical protein